MRKVIVTEVDLNGSNRPVTLFEVESVYGVMMIRSTEELFTTPLTDALIDNLIVQLTHLKGCTNNLGNPSADEPSYRWRR